MDRSETPAGYSSRLLIQQVVYQYFKAGGKAVSNLRSVEGGRQAGRSRRSVETGAEWRRPRRAEADEQG